MEKSTSSVIAKIEKNPDNPLDFDELVVSWNALCEQYWAGAVDESQFAEVENAAITALTGSVSQVRSGHVGYEISHMLNTFDYPTFLVTSEGRIAAVNAAAESELELYIGDTIDSLPYAVNESIPVSNLIAESLKDDKSSGSDLLLKRAYGKNSNKEATIAISVSPGRTSTALVFVITTQWKSSSTDILKSQFGLTDAEAELLVLFVDGYSSQDIATLRNRSHTTIRTQFQSIFAKTGARSQVELLRTTLSVSNFIKDIGVIVGAVNHPYRRRAEILREGGRLVEVTLMGDLTGKPVVSVAMASVYTFSANFEQMLFDAGIYIISMCTPGCGRTDPIPIGQTRMECIAQDLRAVLDQLKVTDCIILASQTNSPILYSLANRLPEYFRHVVQVSSCAPIRFNSLHKCQSTWTSGILRASIGHPAMKLMLLKGAIKAWATIGMKQFMRLQLSSNPIDAKYLLLPENLREAEHALKTATQTGINAVAEDIVLSFGDWSQDIESLPMKITMVQGQQDMLYGIEPLRALATEFSDKIDLIEIEDAGFTLIQSHPAEIIEVLHSVA